MFFTLPFPAIILPLFASFLPSSLNSVRWTQEGDETLSHHLDPDLGLVHFKIQRRTYTSNHNIHKGRTLKIMFSPLRFSVLKAIHSSKKALRQREHLTSYACSTV